MNTTEKVEYGVEITWPSGRVEVWPSDRELAEYRARLHDARRYPTKGRLVSRTVVTTEGDWALVDARAARTGETP